MELELFLGGLFLVLGTITALFIAAAWAAGEVGLKMSLSLFLGSAIVGGLAEILWHGTVAAIVGGALASGILGLIALIIVALVKKFRERHSASR